MIRIVKMSGQYYGTEPDGFDTESQITADSENIKTFVEEGNPVILADDLATVAEMLQIDIEDIIFVA